MTILNDMQIWYLEYPIETTQTVYKSRLICRTGSASQLQGLDTCNVDRRALNKVWNLYHRPISGLLHLNPRRFYLNTYSATANNYLSASEDTVLRTTMSLNERP